MQQGLWIACTQKARLPAINASTRKTRKMTSAMAKSTLAIVALAADTPEKPRKPAISEMTMKIRAYFSMAMPPIVSE